MALGRPRPAVSIGRPRRPGSSTGATGRRRRDLSGMRVFRRPPLADEASTGAASSRPQASIRGGADLLLGGDAGPVLVAVDGQAEGWDALEWAAAEAAARQVGLRIVHAVRWPGPPLGLPGGLAMNRWDPKVESTGMGVLEEAVELARGVAPTVPITTHLHWGDIAQVVLREGRRDSLIVLGRRCGRHRRSVARSLSSQVARRSNCPVLVVGLQDEISRGPSLGRVVVSADGTQDPTIALGFAFRAAQRRDAGVTAILGWSRRSSAHDDTRVARALRVCREAFPGVEVRERVVALPAGSALVRESAGAALVVLGSRTRGRLRRRLFESVESVLGSARSPVAVVRDASGSRLVGTRAPTRDSHWCDQKPEE